MNGIAVPIKEGGEARHIPVKLFDFENPENNEYLAINQFTVIENNNNRRTDIVLFINGLPLVVIELKNLADEKSNYVRDHCGRYPKKIIFKNPLGELVTATSPLEKLRLSDGLGEPNYIKMYKDYSLGMDFP